MAVRMVPAAKAAQPVKRAKAKKKWSLVSVVLICFVLFCSVKVVELQVEISQKEYELQQLQQQLEEQEKSNADIEAQIAKGEQDKDENYGRIAFEQYGYGYPDEHIYIDGSAS